MVLAVTWAQGIVGTLLILICILLILVILIQKGRGGGLAGAFGGAGGHSAFGAKTGDVFTWITVCLTFAFILMAVIGNYLFIPPKLGTPPVVAPTPGAPGQADPAEAVDEPVVPPTTGAPATRPN